MESKLLKVPLERRREGGLRAAGNVFKNDSWDLSAQPRRRARSARCPLPLLAKGGEKWGTLPGRSRNNLRNLRESLDRGGFVFFHVEDGVQLGDLKQVVNFFGEV
jgi:hypothetical protein